MKRPIKILSLLIKKGIIISCLLVLFSLTKANAQLTVPTTPQNKNFFIERGSGMACCSCPGITDKCMTIVNSYPKGKGIFMVYHFGPDARPQSGQLNKDYKTTFGDSILTPVWPFYLNMMVNRRDGGPPYGSTFIFGPSNDQVTPECTVVAAQVAPVNLAMSSSYNATTREITVNAKAYYTSSSATAKNYLQIAITEDSIIGPQCVNSAPFIYNYVHMDMFRANINGFSGAPITTTTVGTTITETYKYIVPAKYGSGPDATAWVTPNIKNFKLIMFMTEDLNGTNTKFGKIQNVVTAPLGATSYPIGLEETSNANDVNVYPNPSMGSFYISSGKSIIISYEVIDMIGRLVRYSENVNNAIDNVDLSDVPNGIYNIKVISERGVSVHRVLLAH